MTAFRLICIGGRPTFGLWWLVLMLAAAAGPDDVRVQRFADPPADRIGLRGEERYSVTDGGVTARLSYVPSSLALTLRVEDHPEPTRLAEQAALLAPLLARFLLDHPDTRHVTLMLTDHAEIVARLAGVLAACADWDGATGRPRRGPLGPMLVDTLNRHDLAAEIAKPFADRGFRLAAQGASLVTVARRADAANKVVPTDIASLAFVADLIPETERRAKWPTQFHSSTC